MRLPRPDDPEPPSLAEPPNAESAPGTPCEAHSLPEPFIPVSPDQVSALATELRAELGLGHVLQGRTVDVVGRCEGCDDVLVRIAETPTRWAVVHLTWTERRDQPPWPVTEILDSPDAVREALKAHTH